MYAQAAKRDASAAQIISPKIQLLINFQPRDRLKKIVLAPNGGAVFMHKCYCSTIDCETTYLWP